MKRMNMFEVKEYCRYVILSALLGFPAYLQAQTAQENFSKSKYALEEGNTAGCIAYLQRCESQLGGSNVRIEAMRAQCYAQMDDWVKAKIAFRNYYTMLDDAERGGDTWEKMAELGREIDAGLEAQDKAFKKKKEDEQKANLQRVEEEIKQHEDRKAEIKNSINKKNGDKLYHAAVETRDPNALTLYKEEAGKTGDASRTDRIEAELDKHRNPNKYLLAAVLDKDQAEAEYLIGLGGDKNLKNDDGNSLLHLAVDTEDQLMQRMLKDKGANIEIRNNNDETPLMYALQKDKYQICEYLLALGADPLVTKRNGITALHYAVAFTTNPRATTLLLEKGADANNSLAYRDTTMSPLYYAVYYRKDWALVQTLVSHGARINEGKTGWTPLMAAVLTHDAGLVQTLLKNAPDVNAQGIHGWTALHFAARENQPEIVTALLKAGASKKIKDEWGRTPKNVAYENETKGSLKALR
jgi:ankyrin repeat protein